MRKLLVLGFVGLLAQLIDGSLGMAYGVTSSTLLLAAGVAPAAASAAVHFSEIGTSLVSGFSHHKLGNVDWKTVSILAVPGFVGAFAGATFLSSLPADTAKPWVAALLLGLGFYVIYRFLVLGGRRPTFKARPGKAVPGPDGPGRWHARLDRWRRLGPGRHHHAALLRAGSSPARWSARSTPPSSWSRSAARSASSSRSGSQGIEWYYAFALLAGGVIAAPIAAWLVKHLAARVLGVAAGGLIVLTNSKTIAEALGATGTDRRRHRHRGRRPVDQRHRLGRAPGAPRQGDRGGSRSSWPRPEPTIEQRPGGSTPPGRVAIWRCLCPFGRVNGSTNLTHWTHACIRQVRLRPAGADRDGLAWRRARP